MSTPTVMAVGITTYVAAMEEIGDFLETLKERAQAIEGHLSEAEQVGAQDAIGVGLNAVVDTAAGSKAVAILDAMLEDCQVGMIAFYYIYSQIATLEGDEG